MATKNSNKSSSNAKSLAKTMRNAPKNPSLSADQRRSSKAAVSGSVASTVGKGKASASSAKRDGVTTSKPSKGADASPRLGRRTAVAPSPITDGKYGTAKAKNTARSNSDHGSAVSGLDNNWGTAPAKPAVPHTRPYGT